MQPKAVTIIGGGLAGLTLGIGLRQRGIPVTVYEAGRYPRHRVCGEFISGRGQDVLARLGLRDAFIRAGASSAATAAFFSTHKSFPVRKLPSPALCLSRHTMDNLLAEQFSRMVGELKQNTRWQGNDFSEGVVRATGRRLQTEENDSRWFGLKIHARNAALAADLEMHVSPGGYVGLCRVNDGVVNVCGLFHRRTHGESTQQARERLRGQAGSVLNERLAGAEFDEDSFCAVAGLSLKPQRAESRKEVSVGDAITMIPPVTGNGMSMAFESAEMAVEPLTAWSHGEIGWAQVQQTVARRCDAAFSRRLAWARFLQWLMFTPLVQSAAGSALMRSEWFWRMMFAKTR